MKDDPLKTCTRCNEALPLDAFYWQKSRHGKRYPRGQCKQCEYAAQRERVRSNPDAHRRSTRLKAIKHKYGLTEAAFDALLSSQGGGCAICATPLTLSWSHIDHSHACCDREGSCGQCVRGVLCQSCNIGLGKFREDPALLDRAKEYLNDRL